MHLYVCRRENYCFRTTTQLYSQWTGAPYENDNKDSEIYLHIIEDNAIRGQVYRAAICSIPCILPLSGND